MLNREICPTPTDFVKSTEKREYMAGKIFVTGDMHGSAGAYRLQNHVYGGRLDEDDVVLVAGDWGMPLGLIMAMLEKEKTLAKYMSGELALNIEVMNQAYPKASKLKDEDNDFKKRAEQLTLNFQNKKQPYYDFWKKLREVSVREAKNVCKLLDADFDLWNGESDASDYIDTVISIFKQKNLARESEGALVVDVAIEGEQIPLPKKSPDEVQRYDNPMPPLIIQKSNGGELYATSDIATIYYRNKLYKPDIIHYLTDARQSQRFIQIFRACKKRA